MANALSSIGAPSRRSGTLHPPCEAVSVEDDKDRQTWWTIRNFSQANGVGEQSVRRVPELLRRVADTIDSLGEIEVQDITFGTEIDEYGPHHHLTVYFHPLHEECDEGET